MNARLIETVVAPDEFNRLHTTYHIEMAGKIVRISSDHLWKNKPPLTKEEVTNAVELMYERDKRKGIWK